MKPLRPEHLKLPISSLFFSPKLLLCLLNPGKAVGRVCLPDTIQKGSPVGTRDAFWDAFYEA